MRSSAGRRSLKPTRSSNSLRKATREHGRRAGTREEGARKKRQNVSGGEPRPCGSKRRGVLWRDCSQKGESGAERSREKSGRMRKKSVCNSEGERRKDVKEGQTAVLVVLLWLCRAPCAAETRVRTALHGGAQHYVLPGQRRERPARKKRGARNGRPLSSEQRPPQRSASVGGAVVGRGNGLRP